MGACLGKKDHTTTNKEERPVVKDEKKPDDTKTTTDKSTKKEVSESASSTPRVKDPKKSESTTPSTTGGSSHTTTTSHKATSGGSANGPSDAKSKGHEKAVSGGDLRKKIEKLFNEFKDENEQDEQDGDEQIGAEGIEKFCHELEIDPEDPVLLAFSYHINATELACFYKEDFISGLEKLKLDSIDSIKDYFNGTLRKEIQNAATLKPIYKYVFDLGKTDPEQRAIGLEMAQGFITMLLGSYPHAANFVEFLQQQQGTKVLNLDQWTSLFEFCVSINPTCSNYDETAAWPCILDDYVQWLRNDRKMLTQSQMMNSGY